MNIEIPERLKHLPFSQKWGLPIPFFVAELNGEPEFRMAAGEAWTLCVNDDLCWVCGRKLGTYRTFAIGPMCCINRLSADPPMHRECAEYSVKVCPFLINPGYVRRQKDRPPKEIQGEIPGVMLERNPGVTLLWTAKKNAYHLENSGDGWLFRLSGEPHHLSWWAHGREATRAEVNESIQSGLPILLKMAQEEGDKAIRALEKATKEAERLLPAA